MTEQPLSFRKHPVQFLVRYGLLTAAGFLALIPFLWMLATAFKSTAETITRNSANPFDPQFWPSILQWSNFVEVWLQDDFGHYFVNSMLLSTITLAGVLITSTLAAYAFARLNFAGKNMLFSLLLATLMVPEVVTIIPNFLVVSALGWVDTWAGLTVPFMGSAFYIFFLNQFIKQIPDALFDAAKMDGASHMRIITRIVVPLTNGPIFTIIFLELLASWNALQWPLLVAQTPRWRPLSVGLARFFSEAGSQMELRMAASLIALVPIVVVFLISQKHITETLTQTGIKG